MWGLHLSGSYAFFLEKFRFLGTTLQEYLKSKFNQKILLVNENSNNIPVILVKVENARKTVTNMVETLMGPPIHYHSFLEPCTLIFVSHKNSKWKNDLIENSNENTKNLQNRTILSYIVLYETFWVMLRQCWKPIICGTQFMKKWDLSKTKAMQPQFLCTRCQVECRARKAKLTNAFDS